MSMRFSIGLLLSVLMMSSIGSAAEVSAGVSAKRDADVSGREMMRQYEELRAYSETHSAHPRRREMSTYEARTSLAKPDTSLVPEVSAAELTALFEKGRDHRPLQDWKANSRRPTWLYPDDGCYARAELVVEEAQRNGAVLPMKVFVFGDLSAVTPNSPDGKVSWWYHVAPVIKSDGVAYVLDPAMQGTAPLKLEEWVKMTTDPLAEVSICASHAYDPDSVCDETDSSMSFRGLRDEQMFLEAEWDRVQSLGRNPVDELGDLPPWLANFHQPQF